MEKDIGLFMSLGNVTQCSDEVHIDKQERNCCPKHNFYNFSLETSRIAKNTEVQILIVIPNHNVQSARLTS
jgi:hypothetical protein